MREPANARGGGLYQTLRPYLKGLIMIGSLVAIGYGLKAIGIADMFDEHWVDAQVKGRGVSGYLLFVAMGGLLAAVGFPRQAISFMGGYAFGFLGGTALAVLATSCGCILSFTYARLMGRGFVQRNFGKRVARFEQVLTGSPFVTTLLIRFLPVGSNLVTNLIAGVTHVRAIPFVLGSAAGYIPQTAIFALMGSGVQVDQTAQIGVGVVLFVISGALGAYLYRHIQLGKRLEQTKTSVEPALEDDEIMKDVI
ncbi:TVP38/TMEM64 family protein [Cohaesibacter intestini]|uniref:TVP38/TMEM64 family protein n=1 Tax=Cohaesibacter intestini TaxID=2211145 RepID=UPI000DE9B97F|nr:VTT domain-containing protein [Cohaesibacter intestini]